MSPRTPSQASVDKDEITAEKGAKPHWNAGFGAFKFWLNPICDKTNSLVFLNDYSFIRYPQSTTQIVI